MSLVGLVLDDPVAAGVHPRDDWWPDALRLSPGVAFDVDRPIALDQTTTEGAS